MSPRGSQYKCALSLKALLKMHFCFKLNCRYPFSFYILGIYHYWKLQKYFFSFFTILAYIKFMKFKSFLILETSSLNFFFISCFLQKFILFYYLLSTKYIFKIITHISSTVTRFYSIFRNISACAWRWLFDCHFFLYSPFILQLKPLI